MHPRNWESFLNQIVIDTVYMPTRAELYKRLGVDWQAWPECRAKDIAKRFERRAAEKSPSAARVSVASDLEGLEGLLMPEETFQIQAMYQDMASFGRGQQLAQKIMASPGDAQQLVSDFNQNRVSSVKPTSLYENIGPTLKILEEEIDRGEVVKPLFGWPLLTEMISGINPGRVTILVAGTGVGKTNLTINFALAAIEKDPVLFFNMEMTMKDIVSRFIRSGAKIRAKEWNEGKFDYAYVVGAWATSIENKKPLLITDGRALTLSEIVSTTYLENDKHNLGLVVVDYDQKIRTTYKAEEWQALQKAVEELEECAKATNTHMIILAQGDEKGDPKASKRIKQSASTVLNFYEENSEFYIKGIKTRHSKNSQVLRVKYEPSKSLVVEDRMIDPEEQKKWGVPI